MHEVEVKILDINPAEIVGKLERFAKKKADRPLWMQFYFFPPAPHITLRLRSGIKNTITAKGPSLPGRAKIRKEAEVRARVLEEAGDFLKELGCRKFGPPKEKRRVTWQADEVLFEIDIFPGKVIPPLLEIEGPDEAHIMEMLDRLEIPHSAANSYGATKVFEHYGLNFDGMELLFSAEERAALPPFKFLPWKPGGESFTSAEFTHDALNIRLLDDPDGARAVCGTTEMLVESPSRMARVLAMLGFTEKNAGEQHQL